MFCFLSKQTNQYRERDQLTERDDRDPNEHSDLILLSSKVRLVLISSSDVIEIFARV